MCWRPSRRSVPRQSDLHLVGVIVNKHEGHTITGQARLQELLDAGIPVLEPLFPKRTAIVDAAEAAVGLDQWRGGDGPAASALDAAAPNYYADLRNGQITTDLPPDALVRTEPICHLVCSRPAWRLGPMSAWAVGELVRVERVLPEQQVLLGKDEPRAGLSPKVRLVELMGINDPPRGPGHRRR